MSNCVFCKIVKNELPSKKVYEDENILAFYDIMPSAPVHVLIIPKKHISSVNGIETGDRDLMGDLFLAAKQIALKEGVSKNGYKLIVNTGVDGGQLVNHLHMHLLGGKKLETRPA